MPHAPAKIRWCRRRKQSHDSKSEKARGEITWKNESLKIDYR
jgi:hypothetical protein